MLTDRHHADRRHRPGRAYWTAATSPTGLWRLDFAVCSVAPRVRPWRSCQPGLALLRRDVLERHPDCTECGGHAGARLPRRVAPSSRAAPRCARRVRPAPDRCCAPARAPPAAVASASAVGFSPQNGRLAADGLHAFAEQVDVNACSRDVVMRIAVVGIPPRRRASGPRVQPRAARRRCPSATARPAVG